MGEVNIKLTITRDGNQVDTLEIPHAPASEVLNEAGLMSVVKLLAYLQRVSGGV